MLFKFKATKSTKLVTLQSEQQMKSDAFKILQEADQSRLEILQIANDDKCETALQLEQLYLQYNRKVEILVQMADSEHFNQKYTWNDSYDPNKYIDGTSIYYELVCSYYNLSILYLQLAYTIPDISVAFIKSRNALWALSKLQQWIPYIPQQTLHQVSDLSLTNIKLINYYCYAFGYKALFDLVSQDPKYDKEKQASILNEAAKYYKEALLQLSSHQQHNSKKMPPVISNRIFQQLSQEYAMTIGNSTYKLCAFYNSQAVENPKVNYMGRAIGYVTFGEKILMNYCKLQKEKDPQATTLLQNVQKLKNDCINKNQMIYKQQIINENELVFKALDDIQIKPKEPEQIGLPMKQQVLQEQQVKLQKLVASVNQLKQNTQNQQETLDQQFHTLNQACNVEKLLEINQVVENIFITPTVQQFLELIRQRGGKQGAEKEMQDIIKQAQAIGMLTINMRNKLNNEKNQQIQAKENTGTILQGTQSDRTNRYFLKAIEDVNRRLEAASKINKQTKESIEQYKLYLDIAMMKDEQIVPQLSESMNVSANFRQAHLQQLTKLSLYYQNILNSITQCKLLHDKIIQFIDDLNLNHISSYKIDDFLNQQIQKQIRVMMDEYDHMCKSIDFSRLESAAQGLNNQHLSVLMEQSENAAVTGFRVLYEQFMNLEYARSFYGQISSWVNDLSQQVDEYIGQSVK